MMKFAKSRQSIVQYALGDCINSKKTVLGSLCWDSKVFNTTEAKDEALCGSFADKIMDVNALRLLDDESYEYHKKFYKSVTHTPVRQKLKELTSEQCLQCAKEAIESVENFFYKIVNNKLPKEMLDCFPESGSSLSFVVLGDIMVEPLSWLKQLPDQNALLFYIKHFVKLEQALEVQLMTKDIEKQSFTYQVEKVALIEDNIDSTGIINEDSVSHIVESGSAVGVVNSINGTSGICKQKVSFEYAFLPFFIRTISNILLRDLGSTKDLKQQEQINMLAQICAQIKYKKICNEQMVIEHSNELMKKLDSDEDGKKNNFGGIGLFFGEDEERDLAYGLLASLMKIKGSQKVLEAKIDKTKDVQASSVKELQDNVADVNKQEVVSTSVVAAQEFSASLVVVEDKKKKLNVEKKKLSLEQQREVLSDIVEKREQLSIFFLKCVARHFNMNYKEGTCVVDVQLKNNQLLYYSGYKSLSYLRYGFVDTSFLNSKIVDSVGFAFWLGILKEVGPNSKIYKNINEKLLSCVGDDKSNLSKEVELKDLEKLKVLFAIGDAERSILKTILKENKGLQIKDAQSVWSKFLPTINFFDELSYDIEKSKFKWFKEIAKKQLCQGSQTSEEDLKSILKKDSSNAINKVISAWCSEIEAKELKQQLKAVKAKSKASASKVRTL